MRVLSKKELLGKIISSIRGVGWLVEVIGSFKHPLKIRIYGENESHEMLIYIWNITHGGKTRSADEYRIQITGVDSLSLSVDYKTLLLGYFKRNNIECFVAFDASQHSTFGFSPSIQVKERTLIEAIDTGMVFQEKSRNKEGDIDEVAIAFRPTLITHYIREVYPSFHHQTVSQDELRTIKKALMDVERPPDEELEIVPEERRHTIISTHQAIRDGSFRERVLTVYGRKCAICGLQVELIEACHIIPVKAGGTDETINGIALCYNHHKALDLGLIGINKEYEITLNRSKLQIIRHADLIGELEEFIEKSRVGEQIFLPDNVNYHPNIDFLVKSLRITGFYKLE